MRASSAARPAAVKAVVGWTSARVGHAVEAVEDEPPSSMVHEASTVATLAASQTLIPWAFFTPSLCDIPG
jgi:hypothetical protein